jgi:hypothetical protein
MMKCAYVYYPEFALLPSYPSDRISSLITPDISAETYAITRCSSWLPSRELNALSDKDISDYLAQPGRKASGDLRKAYETAQDPTEWDVEQAERRAVNEAAEEEHDELDEEDGEAGAGGKRKRADGAKKSHKKKA